MPEARHHGGDVLVVLVGLAITQASDAHRVVRNSRPRRNRLGHDFQHGVHFSPNQSKKSEATRPAGCGQWIVVARRVSAAPRTDCLRSSRWEPRRAAVPARIRTEDVALYVLAHFRSLDGRRATYVPCRLRRSVNAREMRIPGGSLSPRRMPTWLSKSPEAFRGGLGERG